MHPAPGGHVVVVVVVEVEVVVVVVLHGISAVSSSLVPAYAGLTPHTHPDGQFVQYTTQSVTLTTHLNLHTPLHSGPEVVVVQVVVVVGPAVVVVPVPVVVVVGGVFSWHTVKSVPPQAPV